MSAFTDQMYATARAGSRGLVTGAPDDLVRRTWGEVHDHARRVAGALAAAGVGPGCAVAVLAGDAADVAPVAQAVWMRGASLTMLQQPTPRTDLAVWMADTCRAARMIGATLTIVGVPFGEAAAPLRAAGLRTVTVADLGGAAPIEPLHPDDSAVALYQLTSGSTGTPKAVEVTHANLMVNSIAVTTAVGCDTATDVMVSWLPLSHDMGMIAFLTHPMQLGIELVVVAPQHFLRRPTLWPELISRYRGTLTAGPNFAYALLALALERAEPAAFDLSSLRIAINGAEPIDARDMHRLADAGARFGLRPGAVTPAYGMAETTLGIAFDYSEKVVNVDLVSRHDLHERGVASPDASAEARTIVSVGVPAEGVQLRIVDDHHRVVPARHVGSIEVRGGAVSRGYLTEDGWLGNLRPDGWMCTGDLGYLDEHGKLYICGRAKDVIVIAGRNIYPTDIERAACTVNGIRAGNAVAVRVEGADGREGFAVMAESALAGDAVAAERIHAEIARNVARAVGYNARAVLVLPPGMLPKTPSGKLQRRKAAELFTRLDAESGDYITRKAAPA